MAQSHFATVSSPLGDEALTLRHFSTREELGRLFEYELELLSPDDDIKPTDLLGQTMTVHLELEKGGPRHFNGHVSRFARTGDLGRHTVYRATLHPWLWFLTRSTDCRIFQQMTVPDVIKTVFRDLGFTDFEESLSQSYRTWEYLVQYRESPFNFVSRLMEQEGIYYFFKQLPDKHMLVLADSYSAHEPTPNYAEVPYFPDQPNARRERDHIHDWRLCGQIQPGAYALNDFDFTRPKANLEAKLSSPKGKPEHEIYDYPGEYSEAADGEAYARVRLEELQVPHEVVEGQANARGLAAGALFSLSGFPRKDQNREYLIVSANYDIASQAYESGSGSAEPPSCHCTFTAIESQTPYRAAALTAKPTIAGPQTAIVVGKAGEDIWTDEYGRVKLQFHWDRRGKSDEQSSCWVRVAQLWAGGKWGGIHIPRIGQEVVVEFLEGDPDRPLVTGRVYNGSNKPPYDLPANQTQSGIKSRSSKGGNPDNFNEIRFEDKKGEEQLFVQAEKNHDIVVKNDETHLVGHDRTKEVKNNEIVKVGVDRTESVGKNESIAIGGDRRKSVEGNETVSVTGTRNESVGKDETISIAANRSVSVTKNDGLSVAGAYSRDVAKDETITVQGNRKVDVSKDESLEVAGNRKHSIAANDSLEVGKKLVISAADEICLVVGKAKITMKSNGDIITSGNDVSVVASGKSSHRADGDITLKGRKVLQN
jgi:type VI secretion system secreted protein VgrG